MTQLLKKRIIAFIDFFYPPFSRYMPEQTFRYAACGGTTTIVDIFMYWFSYNYILHQNPVHLPFTVHIPFTSKYMAYVSAYVASIFLAFCVSFPTGFFLNRNIVFSGSVLHGRVQLFRYFVLVLFCLFLNWVLIKFFVEQCHMWPTIAKLPTTAIVICFSYVTQKHFTFKAAPRNVE